VTGDARVSEGRLGSGSGRTPPAAEAATAAASLGTLPTGAAAGYRPERTLRLFVELRRQFKRRRTLGVFVLMVALPLILIGALHLGSGDNGRRGNVVNLVDVATASGLNFTLFVLFASSGFFLVVVFALFFGDTVASEASWGSLRYLMAIPVPRNRLLRQKWYAALILSVGALLTLVVVSVVAGGITYGFGDVQTPIGFSLPQGTAMVRLAGMVGYLAVHLLVVGALAFWLSTITDAPLAAVGGAVFTMIVFAVLEQVQQLGSIRNWFPSAYGTAWTDLLQTPVDSANLFRGVIQALVYVAVLTLLGLRHFHRRDVTS
jgi:ABC-2 type transport system permease protein